MSQAGIINVAGGGGGGAPIQTLTADDATVAVPVANNINLLTNDTTANNANGIRDTASGSTFTIELTNRLQGTVTTVGGGAGLPGTATIISFTPTVIGVYGIEYRVAAFNTTSTLGSGASLFGAIRFDGVNSTICDLFDEISNDEGAMSAIDISVTTSGASVLLQGTGYALQTINWSAVGLYTFVGA